MKSAEGLRGTYYVVILFRWFFKIFRYFLDLLFLGCGGNFEIHTDVGITLEKVSPRTPPAFIDQFIYQILLISSFGVVGALLSLQPFV